MGWILPNWWGSEADISLELRITSKSTCLHMKERDEILIIYSTRTGLTLSCTFGSFLGCGGFALAFLTFCLFLWFAFIFESAQGLAYPCGSYAGLFFRCVIEASGCLFLKWNVGVVLDAKLVCETSKMEIIDRGIHPFLFFRSCDAYCTEESGSRGYIWENPQTWSQPPSIHASFATQLTVWPPRAVVHEPCASLFCLVYSQDVSACASDNISFSVHRPNSFNHKREKYRLHPYQ